MDTNEEQKNVNLVNLRQSKEAVPARVARAGG
jgi:hypothetical protein